MAVDAGSAAARELLVVFVVAGAGLLLALVAAFAPWHPMPGGTAPAAVVEVHSPTGSPAGTGLIAADG